MARETCARKVTFFPYKSGAFGTPVALINCVGFNTKNNYKEREYSSDGVIESSTSRIESVDVELEMSTSMMPEIMSKITGQTYSDCKLVTRVGASIPVGAIAYEIGMDDESCRRRVLYSVSLRNDEKNNTTDSEGETIKFTGKAIPFYTSPSVLDVDLLMDSTEVEKSSDADVKADFDAFFTKVILPITPSPTK